MPTYSLNDLPPLVREMLETSTYRDARGVTQSLHSNVNSMEATAIHGLVRDLKPKATAEIGFAFGVSGMAILSALAANGGESRHYACDPGQTNMVAGMGLELVRRAGLEKRLEFYEKFPEEVFPKLPPLQFGFIDASHLFDLSILDFLLVDKRLEVGGVVGFHDLWMPSLRKVVRYLLTNRAYRIHPATPPGHPPTRWQPLKSGLASLARHLPYAKDWLAPEAAKPWHEFHLGNMVFLEKLQLDERDWKQHITF